MISVFPVQLSVHSSTVTKDILSTLFAIFRGFFLLSSQPQLDFLFPLVQIPFPIPTPGL